MIIIQTLFKKLKKDLIKSIGPGFNFRRVENVGPKVSAEF